MWDFMSPWTWANIGTMATPVVLIVGFIFAWYQIKATRDQVEMAINQINTIETQVDASRKQRMASIAIELYKIWDSGPLEKSRQALSMKKEAIKVKEDMIKAEKENSDELFCLARVGNFFDTLGALVLAGCLDKRIAYDLVHAPFNHYYGLYKDLLSIEKYRDFFPCLEKLEQVFTQEKADRKKITVRPT